jgi:hypothetical protein
MGGPALSIRIGSAAFWSNSNVSEPRAEEETRGEHDLALVG